MKKIKELINNNLSENIIGIEMLPASGSSRIYFRIITEKKTLIATYSSNIEENETFLYFSKHFKSKNLPVPEILAVNDDKSCYIQSDFGDTSLFDYVKKCLNNNTYDDTTINLYKKAIADLVRFQINGHVNLDYSMAFPTPSFDKTSIIDDLNYFKYYFLKLNEEITFNETRLNSNFQKLADYAMESPSDFFMYRDFQSRNIMIKDNTTFFIDYQGGRKGPLQYDLVSLLYQVKAQIPNKLRNELLDHYKNEISKYLDVHEIAFDKYYSTFVLIRLLQVLGAYGFRGLIQKKQHFIESIPFALKELVGLKNKLTFPFEMNELMHVLEQMEFLISKYQVTDNERLTVVVNSFSYKNGGIPQDLSGNGGGFVVLVQLEQFRMGPGVCRVHSHINGNVTDDFDIVFVGVGLQLPVLLEELKLQIHLELDVEIQFPAIVVHGIAPAQANVLGPFIPALTAKEILQRHKQRIVIQPPAVFCQEFLVFRILADIAALIGHGQKNVTAAVHFFVIDVILIVTEIHAVALFPGQDALINQGLQINKVGIARKGGKGLVRRITVGCGMNGKNLPEGLSGFLQPVHEGICFF